MATEHAGNVIKLKATNDITNAAALFPNGVCVVGIRAICPNGAVGGRCSINCNGVLVHDVTLAAEDFEDIPLAGPTTFQYIKADLIAGGCQIIVFLK